MSKKKSSKVITIVLSIAFGIIALIIGYATFKGGTFELRSRATDVETIIKKWKFETDAEGWSAQQVGKFEVKEGSMVVSIHKVSTYTDVQEVCKGGSRKKEETCKDKKVTLNKDPRIEIGTINTPLVDYPKFKFRMRLALFPATSSATPCVMPPPCAFLPAGCDPDYHEPGVTYCDITATPTPTVNSNAPTQFPLVLSYKVSGSNTPTSVRLDAPVDTTTHEYTIDLPESVALKTLQGARLSFASMRKYAGYEAKIEEISLIGVATTSASLIHYAQR